MKWFALIATALLAFALLYLSRFWIFDLWGRPGLFGWAALRPQGGLVEQWLRGTSLRPFALIIWAVGAFLVLTFIQNLIDRLKGGGE